MLHTLPPEEVLHLFETFRYDPGSMTVPAAKACGKIAAGEIRAREDVPGFTRSTVDGYAVRAGDTFGCSESIPALLFKTGIIEMGRNAPGEVRPDCCMEIPTGGVLPPGADAVVMTEHAELYPDGSIGILKPVAPGENLIFKGDDVREDTVLLKPGERITPGRIGTLLAAGVHAVSVQKPLTAGILSTGDELVPPDTVPAPGQVRDVNAGVLEAYLEGRGVRVRQYGILKDEPELIERTLLQACGECDIVLISGGSSVGVRDATASILQRNGTLLFHGIAVKPGKPTMFGTVLGKPVAGLPGHPAAAYLVMRVFFSKLLTAMGAPADDSRTVEARLSENVSSNAGRASIVPVKLLRGTDDCPVAEPVISKSGLITPVAGADGYFLIPRDREGMAAGEKVSLTVF